MEPLSPLDARECRRAAADKQVADQVSGTASELDQSSRHLDVKWRWVLRVGLTRNVVPDAIRPSQGKPIVVLQIVRVIALSDPLAVGDHDDRQQGRERVYARWAVD